MPYQNPYLQTGQVAPYPHQGYGANSFGAQQQPVHGFVYVTGIEGAKAYQLPPNSEMPLFDYSGDVMYIKTTDGAGFPTIVPCKCKKMDAQAGSASGEYVTRDELDRAYRDLAGQLDQIRGALHGTVPDATDAGEPGGRKGEGAQADGGRKPGGGVFPAHAD